MGLKRRNKAHKFIWNLFLVTLLFFIITITLYFSFNEGNYSISGFVNYIMNNNRNDEFTLELKTDTVVEVFPSYNLSEFEIGEELLKQINNFFILRYNLYGGLKEPDYSQIYTYTSSDMMFDEAVHDYLNTRRVASTVDLTFSRCEVYLFIDSFVYVDDTIAEITLSENFYTVFNGLSETSSYQNINHFFIFKKETGTWKIDRHDESSKVYDYMNEVFNEILKEKGMRPSDLSRIYMDDYIREFKGRLLANRYKYKANNKQVKTKFPYNRKEAVEYALAWANSNRESRNLDGFLSYELDSTNYTSQCLWAGGIPMDFYGEEQWKWFGKSLNYSEAKIGCSESFINSIHFYKYITKNKGFGLKAKVSTINLMEPGDIIQFARVGKNKKEKIYYQCIVTGKVENELLLSAHSDDIRNFPMSALGFNFSRPIKILGYNIK